MSSNTYTFSQRANKVTLGLIGLGVLGLIMAFAMDSHNQHSRFWSNVLVNAYYFTGISLAGIFFAAANQVGYAGWHTQIKRVMDAFGAFLPVTFIFVALILGGLWGGWHNLYSHWADPAHVDALVAQKLPYLNKGFFTIRILVYFGLWMLFAKLLKNLTLKMADTADPVGLYKKHKAVAAVFLLVFGVTSSTVSWDLIMSLEPHWYSTLFGWYNFASYMCAGLAFMIIFIVYFKSKGLLPGVNENHVHDLGKFMFAFSVFYTYLWFSQFLLIWYGNIPEDTQYYIKRWDISLFKFLFYFVLIINFFIPLLVLMTRASKRNFNTIIGMSLIIIGGHYLDFYMMVMPEPNMPPKAHHGDDAHHDDHHSTVNYEDYSLLAENQSETNLIAAADDHHGDAHGDGHGDAHGGHGDAHGVSTYAGLGLAELFIFLGFIGAFVRVVLTSLSTGPLTPEKDPFLKESEIHHQ